MKTKYVISETNNKSLSPPNTIELDPDTFDTNSVVDKINVLGKYAFLFKIVLAEAEKVTIISARKSEFFWIYRKQKQ